MYVILFISILISYFCGFTAHANDLSRKIDAIIEQRLPHATVGVLVKDVETDQTLYSRHADQLLYPASSIKLLTGAAALYQWKPNHTFITRLSKKDEDIYLTFSGAPDLTTEHLNDLFKQLEENEGSTIAGQLYSTKLQYADAIFQ